MADPHPATGAPRRRPSPAAPWWRGPQLFLVALLAAIGALTVLQVVSVGRDVGPGRVSIRAHASTSGHTEVGFPPLGRVTASTHRAPLAVRAHVEEIDLEALQDLLERSDPERALRTDVEADLPELIRAYALRALVFATLAGGAVGAIVPGRRLGLVVVGALTGLVVVAAVLLGTWRDFEPAAFDEPRFTGALERAPQVIDAVERHVDDLPAIRDRVDVLSAQLSRLYTLAASPPEPLESESVRILHVSDIHSNPLAVEIVERLAERFDAAAVLDTGDLTSFGYPVEGQLGQLIERIDRRYLFVPGNHDSDAVREAIGRIDNVEIVDAEVVEVDGVRILGVADPTFTANNEIDSDEAAARREAEAARVARLVRREEPDLLAVHDRRMATESHGSVPLVVSGHFHRRSDERESGTLVLTVGSTGATGLGSFTVEGDLAYEAQLLHFVEGELRLIDYFWFEGLTGNYRIERTIVDDDQRDEDSPVEDTTTSSAGRNRPDAGHRADAAGRLGT